MQKKLVKLLALILALAMTSIGYSQPCTHPGQTPSTAFPVCGTSIFEQKSVPLCSTTSLYVPNCDNGAAYENRNPYWYKFTCFKTGTLGFIIDPMNASDDYDWQLYDITGLDPEEVFTNRNIIVTGNWAGNPGPTGTSTNGVNFIQCASSYNGRESRFAKMPVIEEGREYILLVSHFTNSQSGYKLTFDGGTASITDPKVPAVAGVTTSCDASKVYVKLNKRMKCSSIAADGSDFRLLHNGIPVSGVAVSTVRGACTGGFDTDSAIVELSRPLPQGNYQLELLVGSDENTMVDNCGRNIEPGLLPPFEVRTLLPTSMDSLAPVTCAPQSLKLVFKKKIACTTIAPDGSNFKIYGPTDVQITGATGDCDAENGTYNIHLQLQSPLVREGAYEIVLQPGALGNRIYDECGKEVPVGSTLGFSVKDTVSAQFSARVDWGCKIDTVNLHHDGRNGVNRWEWLIDGNTTSDLQSVVVKYDVFDLKNYKLRVSNGFCSDSTSMDVLLDNYMKAGLEITPLICPEDSVVCLNTSSGRITSYHWDFGNGIQSTLEQPGYQRYPLTGYEKQYDVRLITQNHLGCRDTAYQRVKVLSSCYIAVPTAFTPNGDGVNDFLYPLNAFKATQMVFRVYNRAGQVLFTSNDWQQKWNGTYKGEPLDSDTYVWTLQYIHADSKKEFFLKGTTSLIR